jgi:hypothetical protein
VVTSDGQRVDDVSEEVWRGAWVSSVIRAIRADPAALINIRCLRCFVALPTPAVEADFLAHCRDFYLRGDVELALLASKGAMMLDEDEGDALGATISRWGCTS